MHGQHAGKNVPRASAESLPFWEGCRAGELRLQRCIRCGAHQFYPRMLCSSCGGTQLAWVRASGRGSIRSYTVVRRPVSKAYAEETPYVVALIRLEEGPTMMSNVIGCDPAVLAVGTAVEVSFETWSEEISIPKFRLPVAS